MPKEESIGKKKLDRGDVATFMRLLSFAKPYTVRLAIGAACSVLGGGSIIAMFLIAQQLLGHILDNRAILHPEDTPVTVSASVVPESENAPVSQAVVVEKKDKPEYVQKLMGKALPPETAARLEAAGAPAILSVCGIFIFIVIVNSLAFFASMYLLQWVGQRIVMDIRVKVFSHLQRLSMSFYNSSRVGDMISRTVADTQMLQMAVTHVVTDAIREPITFLVMLAYILIAEWQLALFSVIMIPTCVMPIIFIGKRIRRKSREGQVCLAEITSVMKEALDGVMVVKAFGQEEREERRFSGECRKFFQRMVSIAKARALNDPITHIIGSICGVGILIYSLLVKKPLEECIMFAIALWMLYEPLKKIGRINMEIQQSSAAGDRIFDILDAPVTVSNKPGAGEITEQLKSLEFSNVVFGYGERRVFESLNLRITAGESLAIVGPSGGGKTTVVSLLLRFFDPDSGSILRNGVDIREFTVESLRANIGLVMQDTFLFNDTIAANIAYGKPAATQEEIEAAARLAHAHEFIVEKEAGYTTMVGERGVSLSGGQKQRLAIARALIRKPSILILDEATSALDTESERYVQTAIDALMGKLTVIVIAHRLSTIAKCDHVAVVGNGGIIEYGTHAELYSNNGVYRELHDLQFAPSARQDVH